MKISLELMVSTVGTKVRLCVSLLTLYCLAEFSLVLAGSLLVSQTTDMLLRGELRQGCLVKPLTQLSESEIPFLYNLQLVVNGLKQNFPGKKTILISEFLEHFNEFTSDQLATECQCANMTLSAKSFDYQTMLSVLREDLKNISSVHQPSSLQPHNPQ